MQSLDKLYMGFLNGKKRCLFKARSISPICSLRRVLWTFTLIVCISALDMYEESWLSSITVLLRRILNCNATYYKGWLGWL